MKNVVGQPRAKQMLELMKQTLIRTGTLPPVLLLGPSGHGKTHLVTEWAREFGGEVIYVNATAVKDSLAFREYFKNAIQDPTRRYLVFVDEAHMLPNKIQDNLLSVLENPAILCTVANKEVGNVHCIDGHRWVEKGDIIREALPKNMSFAFATTDSSRLKDTILNRLRKINLEPYTIEDKIEIAINYLAKNDQVLTDIDVYHELARRSRSIRQLCSELCETYIDISVTYQGSAQERLSVMDSLLGIDKDGATDLDRKYMEYISVNGIASLATMAGYLKIDKDEIVGRLEPFLLEKGWIQITGKGRILTNSGCNKLNESPDGSA